LTHPLTKAKKAHQKAFVRSDEFSKIREDGEIATIGEFIKLDIAPKQIHIKIFRGISDKALSILAERIFLHKKTGDTKIVLKRSVQKGRYTYATWLSVKELKTMSKETLFEKLKALTKLGQRQVQIIVRQNIIDGYIQQLFKNTHSLL
jgi:hypothetical protein